MKSQAYRVASYNHVMGNWHRKEDISVVLRHLKQIEALVLRRAREIEFKRVYIPKNEAKTSFRPLGVPTAAWRVYLHMYNNLLVNIRLLSEGYKQHAYLPTRGVISAWEEIAKRLDRCGSIYEYDLSGFFDRVSARGVESELEKMKLPEREVTFVCDINTSRPRGLDFRTKGENPEVQKSGVSTDISWMAKLKAFWGLGADTS